MYGVDNLSGGAGGYKRHGSPWKKALKVVLGIVLVLAVVGLAAVVVLQQMKLKEDQSNETQELQRRIAKIMLLPDEEAVVTEIDDAEKVREQPFFAQVENGDKVLIFPGAARIVIYRPGRNLIVNVGPIVDDTRPTEMDTEN